MGFREAALYYDRGNGDTFGDWVGKWLRYRYQQGMFKLERSVLNDRQLYRYRVWRNQLGVSAAADPRELRYIDPMEVQKSTGFHPHYCWRKIGLVRGGDWDVGGFDMKENFNEIYTAIQARYVEGEEWEEIPLVQDVLNEKRHWHHHIGEEIWEWCDHLDQLYESMKSDGYLAQREVLGMTFSEACESDSVSVIEWMDDVRIDIGRNGQLLRHDGRHRLWFAQLLDIDSIPVCVVVRHRQWQELRDEIANANHTEELSERAQQHVDHPDMKDVKYNLTSHSQ